MFLFRWLGILLVVLGFIFCLTIIGAHIGVAMIVIGCLLYLVGKKRDVVVVERDRQH